MTSALRFAKLIYSGSGLYYYRNRYYLPQVGRFISEDALGFTGGNLNFYSYAGDSPLKFVDPTGLSQRDRDQMIKDAAEAVAEMIDEGYKLDANGNLNNIAGSIQDVARFFCPFPECEAEPDFLGCTAQVAFVYGRIEPKQHRTPFGRLAQSTK